MGSLALKLDPKTWEDFYFQDPAVRDAKHWIEKEDYPNLIFISGPPGVGKTRFAKLLVQTVHCLNRKPGEFRNCGHCEVCKKDPRDSSATSNVVWVQAGTGEQMAKMVRTALQEANEPPYAAEEHRWYKFIVFDELQTLKQHLDKLLFYPDLQRTDTNRIIFIGITMNISALDDVDLEAFKSRASYLNFQRLSHSQIYKILQDKFPKAPVESLRMIATESNGNIRAAYNRLEDCFRYSENLNPVEVSIRLQFCDARLRKKLWQLTEKAVFGAAGAFVFKELREFWESLEHYVSEEKLLTQLIEDLCRSFELNPTETKQQALSLFIRQQSSEVPLKLSQFMKVFTGQSLIDYELFDQYEPTVPEVIAGDSLKK